MRQDRAGTTGRKRVTASVWAAALVFHALVVAWFGWSLHRAGSAGTSPIAPAAAATAAGPARPAPADLTEVALLDDRTLGPPLVAPPGPADLASAESTHPVPGAAIDVPGARPAAAGGGAVHGGVPGATGRLDPTELKSQLWNDPHRYQLARQRDASRASTPESLTRRPDPAFDARDSLPRARTGSPTPHPGDPARTSAGADRSSAEDLDLRRWRDADPVFDSPPAGQALARADGSTQSGRARPLVDRGQRAVDTQRSGRARDNTSARQASDARDPMPIELSRPSAGTGQEPAGVRGAVRRPGASPRSARSGTGTAQTRADVPPGPGRPATRATRQDPYFHRMYQRIDAEVRFPHQRALALDQGQVIVTFILHADGAIDRPVVIRSSGFADFDRELLRALEAAAPFGPVPRALLGRSNRLVVTAPYWFKSPLIR